jgi:hypothetical protein
MRPVSLLIGVLLLATAADAADGQSVVATLVMAGIILLVDGAASLWSQRSRHPATDVPRDDCGCGHGE